MDRKNQKTFFPRNPMSRKSLLDDFDFIRYRQAEINIEEGTGCTGCGTTVGVIRGSRGCTYDYGGTEGDADDPNYGNFCPQCWKLDDDYWRERWEEYYGMVMG
jgi:hypothetical protein